MHKLFFLLFILYSNVGWGMLRPLAKVSFNQAEQTAHEGERISVDLSLDHTSDNFIYVPYEVTGSASFGTDHNLKSGILLFFPGQETNTLSIDLFVDQVIEPAKNITIKISSPIVNATHGAMSTHTITIPGELPANHAPVMSGDQNFQGNEDTKLTFTLNGATDSDGDSLTYNVVSAPAQGTLENCLQNSSGLTCDYFPPANFSGVVNFSYRAFDGKDYSVMSSNVSLTINAVSTQLPIADFSLTFSNGGVVPTRTNFNGALSYLPGHENDPDRGISSCLWELTGGFAGARKIIVPGCTYEPMLTESGHHSLKLTVTAINNQSASVIKDFDLLNNQIPNANFSVDPESGTAPLNITLNASGSLDPDGGVISEFQWNFGNGDTLITTNTVTNYVYQTAGIYVITLVVRDNEGTLSSPKTFNLVVTSPAVMGTISGITYKEGQGVVGGVPVVLNFTNGTQFNAISDSNGKFSFFVPTNGDFNVEAQLGAIKGNASGSLTQTHSTEEIALKMIDTGIGKVSGTVLLVNGNVPADGAKVGLKFTNSDQVLYATTDANGYFTFVNLPLNGNFWLSTFHPASGSRRNIFAFIDSTTPEQNNLSVMLITPTAVPSFSNGSFEIGDFSSWFSFGDNVLVPQNDSFGNNRIGKTLFTKANTSRLDSLILDFSNSRELYRAPRRMNLKSKKLLFQDNKTLPCGNSIYSALSSTAGFTSTQLSQEITIDANADTLIGRIRLLTNETLDSAGLGYNDNFLGLLINPLAPKFIFLSDVANITWKPGNFGYTYSSDEIPFAIDVKDLAGLRASLAFGAIDKGDDKGDSAIIISNLQFLKTSDRNFVEVGAINGDASLAKNVGAVSWFKVKNTNAISAINLDQNNFHILKNNQEVEIPSVMFGSEPIVRNFSFDALYTSDIFTYSLDSSWVSAMPTQVCSGGGR